MSQRRPDGGIQIFISHSSEDTDLAKALIDLLEKALPLGKKAIRCTSVDGYRLRAGASINDTLRAEVHGAKVVLALLTQNAMKSIYVAFELGVRWGSGRPLIPVLARGLTPHDLKAPLNEINAATCENETRVSLLVSDVAEYLNVNPKITSLEAEIREFLAQSGATPGWPGAYPYPFLDDERTEDGDSDDWYTSTRP